MECYLDDAEEATEEFQDEDPLFIIDPWCEEKKQNGEDTFPSERKEQEEQDKKDPVLSSGVEEVNQNDPFPGELEEKEKQEVPLPGELEKEESQEDSFSAEWECRYVDYKLDKTRGHQKTNWRSLLREGYPAIDQSGQTSQKGLTSGIERKHYFLDWKKMAPMIVLLLFCLPPGSLASETHHIKLEQGTQSNITFNIPWTPDDDLHSFYTIRLKSQEQPFCTATVFSALLDPEGFRFSSQSNHFRVYNDKVGTKLQITITISDVSPADAGKYILTRRSQGIRNDSSMVFEKEVQVYRPYGKAECATLLNDTVVYCQAAIGTENITLVCHQDGFKLPYQTNDTNIYDDGSLVHGLFLKERNKSTVYCCSLDDSTEIDLSTCKDYPKTPTMQNNIVTDEPDQDHHSGVSNSGFVYAKPVATILIGLYVYFLVIVFVK